MKTFYIQTDSNGYIKDIIEYPYGDYTPIQYNYALPNTIMAGYHKWDGKDFTTDETKKAEIQEEQNKNNTDTTQLTLQINELKEENQFLKECILEICDTIYGGITNE